MTDRSEITQTPISDEVTMVMVKLDPEVAEAFNKAARTLPASLNRAELMAFVDGVLNNFSIHGQDRLSFLKVLAMQVLRDDILEDVRRHAN